MAAACREVALGKVGDGTSRPLSLKADEHRKLCTLLWVLPVPQTLGFIPEQALFAQDPFLPSSVLSPTPALSSAQQVADEG